MKRILALILAILLVLGTFVACTENEPIETEKKTEKQTQTEDEGAEDNTDEGTDEEIDKESNKETDKETNEAETCTEHIDADKNHACDKCKAGVGTHTENATDGDHVCDYGCGTTLTACADFDKNHKCDDCQTNMGAHEDSTTDSDHLCDYGCGVTVTSCEDNDKNHKCDTCETAMGTHSDSANDGDHKCDYGCGATLTECADSNSDGNCDDCGKSTLYVRSGKKIAFGSYPQTKVTDSSLTATLNGMAGTLPTSENAQLWTSYGYYIEGEASNFMWYIDITTGGEKYRGVYFTSYRPYYTTDYSSQNNSKQYDNGYETSTVYWFKYEPISWTILSENTTDGTALILCDMIIDSQAYQNEYEYDSDLDEPVNTSENVPEGTYANNYKYSTVRKWLNETFYNTAFNALQKALIPTTTVDNSAATTSSSTNQYACENTQDNIFLLSYQDVINSDYGFSSSHSTYDTVRQKKITDYAKVQGAWTEENARYAGNGIWNLRSPYNGISYHAHAVSYIGTASGVGDDVNLTYYGVAPALQIKL